jgi:hypothetical protein
MSTDAQPVRTRLAAITREEKNFMGDFAGLKVWAYLSMDTKQMKKPLAAFAASGFWERLQAFAVQNPGASDKPGLVALAWLCLKIRRS